MEDIVVIEHCKDCDKHKWCTNHEEKKYKDIYEKTRSQIENECPEVTVLENQDHPSIQGIITQKTERTPFAKLSFPKTGSFEVYFRGKIIFSKLKHGIWPHPAMIAKNIRDIIDGNVEVKATQQATGFKEFQSKPEVPRRSKPAAVDKQETPEKKSTSPNKSANSSSPIQPHKSNKVEEKKAESPKPQVGEKKQNDLNQGKGLDPPPQLSVKEEKKQDAQKVSEEHKLQTEVTKNNEVPKEIHSGSHDEHKMPEEGKKKEEAKKSLDEPPKHDGVPKSTPETNKPADVIKQHDEPPNSHELPPKSHAEPHKTPADSQKHEEHSKPAAEPQKNHEELHKLNEDLSNTHEEPPKHYGEPPKHHEELPKHQEEPPKYHEESLNHHEEPTNIHEEPPKHHEEPVKSNEAHPLAKKKHENQAKDDEEDEDIQVLNAEPPYPVTETFSLPLVSGEGKNYDITLKNTKEVQQIFHVQVKNNSLIKVVQSDYTVDPGVPQKLKLEILPQNKVGVYRGYIIVESEHEVVACNEIVVEVN